MVFVVIVGRSGDDDQLSGAVCRRLIGGGLQVERALACVRLFEKALDLVVLDRADEYVELFRLCVGGGDRGHLVLLCEENCQ